MTADLDVVIVSFNTRDLLAQCLQSIAAHPPAYLHRIVVVDNASTDGSAEAVRAGWPDVDVIALDRNVGFGAANNVAIRAGVTPLVLLLNSDTIVPPGSIDALVERLEATGAAAAGPRLADASGWPEISWGAMLTPWTEIGRWARGRVAASRSARARRGIERRLASERDVDWVSGACLLLRRDRAIAAGLFDERFFMYEEDVDLCAAIRASGGRILFTPHVSITHLGGQSIARGGGRSTALYDRSHVRFYEKHAPFWARALRVSLRLRGRRLP